MSFESSRYTVSEGSTTTVAVVLSSAPGSELTVPLVATDEGGAGSADYSGVPADVTFSANDTEFTFVFDAHQDTEDDDGESVRLTFGKLSGGVTRGDPATTTVSITDDDVPDVSVSFGESSYSVLEGATTTVSVVLSVAPERSVTIPLTATNHGGATGSDYRGVPESVTFESGDTEKEIAFGAIQDSLDDDGEGVRLTFGGLPDGVTGGSASTTTISITDDDDPSVTVSFEQGSYTVSEGATTTISVTLSADPERSVTVPLMAMDLGGATSTDYSGVPASLTFRSEETEKAFVFSATQDTDDDDGESVRLTFGTLPTSVTEGTPAATTISLTDDDDPSVAVSFEQDSYTVSEGATTTISVKLSADPERTVTVPLMTMDLGGATSTDYSGVPTSLTFESGQTEKAFVFSATQDTDDDNDESVRLTIGTLPAGVTRGAEATTTVSITDDDVRQVTVSFQQGSYSVAEGATTTVTVVLNVAPERSVTIPLAATNQEGATGSDYRGLPPSVTFDSGDTEKEIAFGAVQDTEDDDGESVRLTFGELPDGVTVGAVSTTTISITDDDDPSVSVSFEQDSYTVPEGATTTITVMLSADPERSVTVTIPTTPQGGATAGDYRTGRSSVTFNRGEVTKTFVLGAVEDEVDDDGESVLLELGPDLPPGVGLGTPSATTVTILDDDKPVSVKVDFGETSYTVAEGDLVTVKVVLSEEPEIQVVVPIVSTDLGGASSTDYRVQPTSLTFGPEETERSFTFTANDDGDNDDGESVRLTFGALPDGLSTGGTSTTTVSITDDDVPQVSVRFGASGYEVDEGATTTLSVKLSADPERTVEIPLISKNQGGAVSEDYSLSQSIVTFHAGDTEVAITFGAVHDIEDDDGESVEFTFGSLPEGVQRGDPATSTVSIIDDDDPKVSVSFAASRYDLREGGTTTVSVVLSADPERSVTVPLTTDHGGGATDSDYSGVPASVMFSSGVKEKSFVVRATEDRLGDSGESIVLGFGPRPGGVTLGSTSTATLAIQDVSAQGGSQVSVSFESLRYSVPEGATTTVKVLLNVAPGSELTVPLIATAQAGATTTDYSGVPSSLKFDANVTEQSFEFTAAQDSVDDDGESVQLSFGDLSGVANLGRVATATIDISDDDVPQVNVRFSSEAFTVAEGGSVDVKVILSANPEREVTVPILKTGQNGATSGDYDGVPVSVGFRSGETEKTIAFSAAQDNIDDDDESVILWIGSTLPTGIGAGSPATTTISIVDDDDPLVSVSFGSPSYVAAEGATTTIRVVLSMDPERSIIVPLTVVNSDGASDSDYTIGPLDVVFATGETEKTVEFFAVDDTIDDDGESVALGFGNLPVDVGSARPEESTVSIADDDKPSSIAVAFGESAYEVSEGATLNVKVTLSEDPEMATVIPIVSVDQGGASTTDYTLHPRNVSFASGETEKTIVFSAIQDADDDDGESVRLEFGNLSGVLDGGEVATATVSIIDDDHPGVTVSFGKPSYTVAEGATTSISVVLNADPERTLAVPIVRVNQGGASADDYSGVPGSLTFGTGETEKSFEFQATQDTEDDDGESVRLVFGTLPDGVERGGTATTSVAVTDDDDLTVSFGEAGYRVAEGATTTVSVNLSANPGRTVTVSIMSAGRNGATSDDYTLGRSLVTFDNGETHKTVSVGATQDVDDDDDESVRLTFGSLPEGIGKGTTATTTVSIDDDDDPTVTVRFGSSIYTVPEGATTTVSVHLSADPERAVQIPLTETNLGGTTPSDHSGVPQSVTFTSGHTEQTFMLGAIDDDDLDNGESLQITLGSLPAGVEQGDPATTTVSITDDDVRSVSVQFEQSSYTVEEGATTTVKLVLDADPQRTVEIPVTSEGQSGATADDFSIAPLKVTFVSGETEKTIALTAVQDEVDDDDEGVMLSFRSLPTGVIAGNLDSTTVWITDDDDPQVSVSFGASSYRVREGGTTTVSVLLSALPGRSVTMPITTTNGGGATDSDYSGVPESVTFASGDTEKTFVVSAPEDRLGDSGESVELGFGTRPKGVVPGATTTTTVFIQDVSSQGIAMNVRFGAEEYQVAEGATTTVRVILSSAPGSEWTVPLTTTGEGGATTTDFRALPSSLTFGANDTERSFVFMANHDSFDDDGESVLLGFGTLPGGVSEGSPATTTVSIADDDYPQVSASFDRDSYTVPEGSTTTVGVSLSAVPERSVTIPLAATDEDGATAGDYSGVPGNVTFASGEKQKTFTFSATQDTDDDDGESVVLTFGILPDGLTIGANATTTVSITDDDVAQIGVSFGLDKYSATEGGPDATVTVELSMAAHGSLVIPLTATGHDGATTDDWSGVPESLTFDTGDISRSFTLVAFDDDVEDNGEMVELGFGTLPEGVVAGSLSTARVTLMNDDEEQSDEDTVLNCDTAVWCAELEFADRSASDWGHYYLEYYERSDPPSRLSDTTFEFRGTQYTVRYIWVRTSRHAYPEMDNSWSRFWRSDAKLEVIITRGRWDPVSESHYRDWTVHFDDLALPFTGATTSDSMSFRWKGSDFHEFFKDWTPSSTTTIGIRETTGVESQDSVPGAPRNLDVTVSGRTSLLALWSDPAESGDSLVSSYKVQWKEASASWTDTTVRQMTVVENGPRQNWAQIGALSEGTLYTVRVIATNSSVDGPPSHEHVGRPQSDTPMVLEAVVDGQVLTLRYNRQMDDSSVPSTDSFMVFVDNGRRSVDTISISGNDVELTLSSPVSAANSVGWRYVLPTLSDAASLRDTDGNYASAPPTMEFKWAANETDRSTLQPLTAGFMDVPESHNGVDAFTVGIKFSEPVWIPNGVPMHHLLSVTGGTVTSAWFVDRLTSRWDAVIKPDSNGDVVVVLPSERPCGLGESATVADLELAAGAPCAAGDRELTNQPEITIPRYLSPGQSDATENAPLVGRPSITGEPVVGETLNADTSGITDADGMDGAVFTHRWLADDVALRACHRPGYPVTEADVGRTLAVRVTFTDDAGNEETVTSEATEAVRSSALQLESANVNGATLTLTYNEDLDEYVSVPVSAFTVTVDGNATAVSSVSVSGLVVTLALSTAVGAGDAVTVSYVRPDGPDFIRSTLGNLGESFSGREVTNDTASALPLEPASPEISSTSTYTVAEGETAVATLTATDVDTPAAELMWSISGGSDSAHFTLSPGGSLAFATAKDFEAPDDSNSDGTYVVTVQVSDGGRTDSADLDVTLLNVNERPTADAGADLENVGQGASVTLDGAGTDPDAGDTLDYGWTRSAGPGVTLSTTTDRHRHLHGPDRAHGHDDPAVHTESDRRGRAVPRGRGHRHRPGTGRTDHGYER